MGRIYVSLKNAVLQVPDDGSASFDWLDGSRIASASLNLRHRSLAVDDPYNLWGVALAFGPGPRWSVWLYHRPCAPPWIDADFGTFVESGAPEPLTPAISTGDGLALGVIGTGIFVAGAFYDDADPTVDIKIRVFALGVTRPPERERVYLARQAAPGEASDPAAGSGSLNLRGARVGAGEAAGTGEGAGGLDLGGTKAQP